MFDLVGVLSMNQRSQESVNVSNQITDECYDNFLSRQWHQIVSKCSNEGTISDHECFVLQDGLGSLANIATATVSQLEECSLSKSRAIEIYHYFSCNNKD
ncbi:hypothetical protein BC833DRAFT_583949 [Globomyces pollinis-pini]|nr:hypothetical protein BC833DRAFT_583949 [Globomyces pollinis-pini]